MPEVSRRGLLKGSAFGAAALVLGWRPTLPPAAPLSAVEPAAEALIPGVVKLAAIIPVTNELLEDSAGIEAYVRERLSQAILRHDDDLILGTCLDERFDSSQDYGDRWLRNQTAFRLTQEWEVQTTPAFAEKMAAEAAA